jgi:hypothetical protein
MGWLFLLIALGLAGVGAPLAVARWWRRRSQLVEVAVSGFPPALSAIPPAPGEVAGVVTGDPVFDGAVTLRGDVGQWLLLATPELRAGLQTALTLGIDVRAGVARGWVPRESRGVVEEALIRLRRGFERRVEPAHRFVGEPLATVRRRLLEWALDHAEREAFLDHAAADPEPMVRLRAAQVRRDAPALVSLATDPALTPAVRDRAFVALREAVDPEEIAVRLLAAAGPASALARERLTALPPATWAEALLARLAERWDSENVAAEVLAVLHALPEHEGRERVRSVLAQMPIANARAVIPRIPARLLSREVVADLEARRPELGVLLRATHAVRHTHASGPDVRDAAALFEGSGWRWLASERRAAGHFGLRYATATPGVGGLLFRLTPVPLPARLTLRVGPDGERGSEVPGTPASLSWFPRHVRDLVRDALPPCDQLQVEDGEVRLRATPETPADVAAITGFLERLADALDALGPLSEAQRVAAAFRTAEPGPVRRKLAAGAFAADRELASAWLRDDDPEVRRVAGRHAPHPPTLVALVADRNLPIPLRSVALTDLHTLGDREAMSAAVRHAWDDEPLLAQALSVTGAARLVDQWPEVARVIDRLAPPSAPVRNLEQELVRKALYVLISLEEPASEAMLLRGTLSRDPALRRASITALGAVGSPTMLRALQSCAEHHPADRPIVERAVQRLRERIGTGGLAVAELEGGQLSEAAGGGQLAEAPAAPDAPAVTGGG